LNSLAVDREGQTAVSIATSVFAIGAMNLKGFIR